MNINLKFEIKKKLIVCWDLKPEFKKNHNDNIHKSKAQEIRCPHTNIDKYRLAANSNNAECHSILKLSS